MNIDFRRIEYIRGLLAADFIPELTIFLSNAQSYVEDMGMALHRNNRAELSALAHKLKSTSAQLGLKDIEDLCTALEYSQHMDARALFTLFSNLMAALDNVGREFKQRYLNQDNLD